MATTIEIQITGGHPEDCDPRDRHSRGKFWLDANLVTREVAVSFPDRFGIPGPMYTFAAEDWDAIVSAVIDVEAQRAEITSPTN